MWQWSIDFKEELKTTNHIALSTCEAEYIALAGDMQEIKFLRQLLNDMSGSNKDDSVVTLYVDIQSAIALA